MTTIPASDLQSALDAADAPIVVDVRPRPAFLESDEMIAGALRRDPESALAWVRALPRASAVVAYCGDGGEASAGVARTLEKHGIRAARLGGGLAAWKAGNGGVDRKPRGASTRWVTRERPKIDRIACPWLIARFVDREAQFLYVPPGEVREAAKARDAVAYDIPDVHFSHQGELCSFDAFLAHYRLSDPALARLAVIVRGADTARLDLAPQAAGLAAVSLGLSRIFPDDHEMLHHGMVMYDALYAWCKEGQDEVHTWNPDAYR